MRASTASVRMQNGSGRQHGSGRPQGFREKLGNVAEKLIIALAFLVFLVFMLCLPAEGAQNTWENEETTFTAILEDDAGLLRDPSVVMEAMKPITTYGNVIFKSIDQNSYSASTFAEQYLHNTFGTDSGTIFLIDMANRKIFIFSDGAIYKTITRSKAEVITDNIYTLASAGDYDGCAVKAFEQIETLLEGNRIAEPMHIIGIALISLLIGMIVCFIIMSGSTKKKEATAAELIEGTDTSISITNPELTYLRKNRTYSPISTGSGGGGGGFSGGGGGSSGGGGGGSSGGGGGHSF